jgi:hypothetical protein
MMKSRMILTAGAALLALAACSKSNNAPTTTTSSNGVTTGAAGLQVNAVGAATACLSPSDINRPPSDFTEEQRRQIVGCINTAAARQVNAQLPKQIDEITRLDSLSTEGPLLTYHYTIQRAASSLPPGSGERLASMTRTMVCGQPQMRQTLQLGGSYAYRWVDNAGVLIHEVRIDNC